MANVGKTYTIYKGPSLIDGAPIVVWFQEGSKNGKTGGMAQTFIQADGLHADNIGKDVSPLAMSRSGGDKSYCGDCVHRGKPNNNAKGQATDRTCYVLLMYAPTGKHNAYMRGSYEERLGHANLVDLGRDQLIRLGAFGDPSAVPSYVWESLLQESAGRTGYTHAKRNPMPANLMSSADTLTQARGLWARGERTFRVTNDLKDIVKGKEVICPASHEAGQKTTCDKCKLCSGNAIKAKSIVIKAHGTSAKKYTGVPA